MIVSAVVCPHPPLLLRELSGAQDAVPELRVAAREALASALHTAPDVVVVVGGADHSGTWDPFLPVDVGSFGTPAARPVTGAITGALPLSLGVATRLLDEARWEGSRELHALAWDATPEAVTGLARQIVEVGGAQDRVVLIVMGDGSTRRGEKAPGYLDGRAFAFDDAIGTALEAGDAAVLAGLDVGLAGELMVLGRAAFGVLGEVAAAQGSPSRTRVLYRDDPHGVMYTVAHWAW